MQNVRIRCSRVKGTAEPLVFLVFVLICFAATAQPAHFTKYSGDSTLFNYGNSLVQLPGGSIFYAGSSNSNVAGGNDLSLTKFDEEGNFIWRKYYGTSDDESCARMIFHDGKLVLCGHTYSNLAGNPDGFLLAADTNGNELWQSRIGNGFDSEAFLSICPANDGGYLACGYRSVTGNPGSDFWLVKTGSGGSFEWENFFGGSSTTETSDAVYQLANGEILISGDQEISATAYNAWVVKADSSGNEIWNTLMTSAHNGGCKNLLLGSDNFVYVIGEAATDSSPNFDIQLSKVDLNGTLHWVRYIRGSNQSDAGFDIVETPAHHFMITGYYYDTTESKKKIQMLLADTTAQELGRKLFGSGLQSIGYDIVPSVNGGYLIAGTDFLAGQCLLIYDDVGTTGIQEFNEPAAAITVFPNPCSDRLFIRVPVDAAGYELRIYNMLGEEITRLNDGGQMRQLDVSAFSPGLYFIRVNLPSGSVNGKFRVE